MRSWAKWNYTGYEGKAAYGEYRDLVNTMRDVGAEHGCGRSFWEYQKEINRYGTPMALMLLPHWTDGCIGSMEGLFFEASATTPFHFLTQVELSSSPSAAQRDLPYGGFDLDTWCAPPPADGCAVLPGHVRASHVRGAGPPGPHGAGHVGAVGHLRGGGQRAGGVARQRAGGARRAEPQPARVDLLGARRQRQVRRTRGHLVPRSRHGGGVPRRVGSGGVAAGRSRRSRPRGAPRSPRRGVRSRGRHRPDLLRRRPGGHAGARQGLLLPQLAGVRRRRPVSGGPQPDGRRAHRGARRAVLRTSAGRVDRRMPSPCSASAWRSSSPRGRGRRASSLHPPPTRSRLGTSRPSRDRSRAPAGAGGPRADDGRRRPPRRPAPGCRVDPGARRPHRHRGGVGGLLRPPSRLHLPLGPLRQVGADARRPSSRSPRWPRWSTWWCCGRCSRRAGSTRPRP